MVSGARRATVLRIRLDCPPKRCTFRGFLSLLTPTARGWEVQLHDRIVMSKSNTRPPGPRQRFRNQCRMRTSTTSAPRPPVRSRISCCKFFLSRIFENLARAEFQARPAPPGHRIAGVNFRTFVLRQDYHPAALPWSLANHQHRLASHARLAHRFQAGVHAQNVASSKLTSSGSAIIPRSTITAWPTRSRRHWVAQARRQPGLFVSGALRKQFVFAVKAIAARNMVETHHPVAYLEFRAPDFHHGPGQFVSQHLRRRHKSVMNFGTLRSRTPHAATRNKSSPSPISGIGKSSTTPAPSRDTPRLASCRARAPCCVPSCSMSGSWSSSDAPFFESRNSRTTLAPKTGRRTISKTPQAGGPPRCFVSPAVLAPGLFDGSLVYCRAKFPFIT